MALVLVTFAFVAVHLLFSAEIFPIPARLLGAAVGVLTFVIVRRADRSHSPFLEFAAVQVYVYFGLATFWNQELATIDGPIMLSDTAINQAALSGFVMLLCFFLASFPGERVGGRTRERWGAIVPSSTGDRFELAVRIVAVALGLAFVAHTLFRHSIPAGIAQPIAILARPPIAQALLGESMRRNPTRTNRLLWWGYTGAAMFAGVLSGMLKEVFVPLLTALYLLWLFRSRVPKTIVFVMIAAFVIVNPAKHAFRRAKIDKLELGESVGVTDTVSLWTDAFSSTWLTDEHEAIDENLAVNTSRVSALLNVAHAFEWIPVQVPFTGGERWLAIPSAYIPRFLWPDKPNMTRLHNGEYALAFDLQTESALEHTAVNFPLPTDGYWAYGWPGVVFVALCVGFLFGFYRGAFRAIGWGEIVVSVGILPYIVPHQHFAQHVTGVPQRLLVFFAVAWAVQLLSTALGAKEHAGGTRGTWRERANPGL
ncbi:MAG: hypothetical protein KC417_03325 [Myxococcales bacterium]|nr:hypothetical protein [Myxococcales bacterium]